MSDLERTVPERAVEARAWTLFLRASYSGMPEDLDSLLDGLTGADPAAGVVPLVKGVLELYRFNPDRAIAAVESVPESGILPRFEPLIRGLALFAAGHVDDALSYALERRQDALKRVDQLSLVTSSYVAALALLSIARLDQLLAECAPDGDAYLISMLLRGASSRFRSTGDHPTAATFGRAANAFALRLPSEGTFIAFEPGPRKARPLTERETEVSLLASGFGNQDIAARMKLSVRTVESHISNALRKTGAMSRQELTEIARTFHT